jgi:hypothetical protein
MIFFKNNYFKKTNEHFVVNFLNMMKYDEIYKARIKVFIFLKKHYITNFVTNDRST